MKKRKPAVISVFSAIVLSLTVALSFLFIDGVRMAGMDQLCQHRVDLTGRNMLANYQQNLYSHYGLLGMDQEFSNVKTKNALKEKYMEELAFEDDGVDFLRYESFEVDDFKYQLLTDGNGAVYRKQASLYMLSLLPQGVITDLMNTFQISDCEEAAGLSEDILKEASDALDEANEVIEESEEEIDQEREENLKDNEITKYQEKKSHPILETILGESNFSENCVKEGYCPSRRKLRCGTMGDENVGIQENFLSLLYAKSKFLNYTTADPNGVGLQYQLEYLVGGKTCDSENLGIVIRRIMEIREGVRFIELLSNSVEREAAFATATALVGFTGNPVLIEAVQMGILLAKAFDKAIKDVRELVNGKKLPITDKFQSAALDYGQYVLVLLLLQNQDKVALRSLDIIENTVNEELTVGDFYADDTVTAMRGKVRAVRPWMFLNYMVIKVPKVLTMTTQADLSASYQ